MLDYANKIKDILLRDYFDEKEGWQLAAHTIKKNNGIVLSGISIRSENEKQQLLFMSMHIGKKDFQKKLQRKRFFSPIGKDVKKVLK